MAEAKSKPTRNKRKPLSKKIRFEVFKRDSFKCQYCGRSAPEVVLHVDHIKPVAEGGTNDLLNLITACADCNLGKGKRKLSDSSVIEKQRKQLEELNERREQLEMLVEWKQGLDKLGEREVEIVSDKFEDETSFGISDKGKKTIKKWVKKYPLEEILNAVEISASTYIKYNSKGEINRQSIEHVFNMIPRIIANIRNQKEHPELKQINYIRVVLKNKFRISNEQYNTLPVYIRMLNEKYGLPYDFIKDAAIESEGLYCSLSDWLADMKSVGQTYKDGD